MMRLLIVVLSLIFKNNFEYFINDKREEKKAIMLIKVYIYICTSYKYATNF